MLEVYETREVERTDLDDARADAAALAARSALGAGYVGILSVELHFPENGSLKGKRKSCKSVKAQLQHRFGASVAEVDHHELWQRSRLTLVVRRARATARSSSCSTTPSATSPGRSSSSVRVEREVVTLDE